jgi:PPOX class probable F420-dependent enzyme
MKLDDSARKLIGAGVDATLVTLNRDGSPQVSVVWVALQSTPDGDELVTAHLGDHKKVRNVRGDSRVAVTIISPDRTKPLTPYLTINGPAHVVEGGAPALLTVLAKVMQGPETTFPPDTAPPGFITHINIDKVGGVGPWVSGHGY